MFQIEHVTLDYGRIDDARRHSHYSENGLPVFGWSVLHGRNGAHQSAVQMKFYDADGRLLWDSGKVETAQALLRYGGEPLPEGRKVCFTLVVTDDRGEESAPYCDYLYNAAIADWNPTWIGAGDAMGEDVIRLRRQFETPKDAVSARLYACGIGYQKLYLDGELLDAAELDPSCTDYRKQCQYIFLPELADKLKAGRHTLASRVAAGWRYNPGTEKLIGKIGDFSGPKEFCAKLIIEFADGSAQIVETDGDWETVPDPYEFASVFNGTRCDAGKSIDGWMIAAEESGIAAAKADVLPAPGGELTPMLIPSAVSCKCRRSIDAWPVAGRGVCFDFGQNLAGVLRVQLPKRMQKGQKITLTHAEELTDRGLPFRDTLRGAEACDVYIAAGDDRDLSVWQPEFTYHGFRYALIEGMGEDVSPDDVAAVEVHTDLETNSHFRCGNALVTRIHEMCVETERGNMHSILTDCPQRDERMQWLNDATVRFEEIPCNFEIGRMFPKVVRDVMDMQREDGAIGCTAPFIYGAIPADPVCTSFLLAGYEAAMHTGNMDVIRRSYHAFDAWEKCLLAHSDDYIVNYSYYGDWAGPYEACQQPEDGSYPGAVSKVTPGIYMSTGFSYRNCRLLEQFAEWLGMEDEAKRHAQNAEAIRDAMLKKFYCKETAVMATGSQGAQAFALKLGIIPEEDAPRAAKYMRDSLADNNYRFTTGNLCTLYLLEMLSKYGYVDDAWRMINREDCPSFGFMLQQEATTIWERFELMTDSTMNSHNHPMYASIDYWMYSCLAGIRATAPNWSRMEIAPKMPKDLHSCQAIMDTARGRISVRWVRRYEKTIVQLAIPFGCAADVVLEDQHFEAASGTHVFIKDPETGKYNHFN